MVGAERWAITDWLEAGTNLALKVSGNNCEESEFYQEEVEEGSADTATNDLRPNCVQMCLLAEQHAQTAVRGARRQCVQITAPIMQSLVWECSAVSKAFSMLKYATHAHRGF